MHANCQSKRQVVIMQTEYRNILNANQLQTFANRFHHIKGPKSMLNANYDIARNSTKHMSNHQLFTLIHSAQQSKRSNLLQSGVVALGHGAHFFLGIKTSYGGKTFSCRATNLFSICQTIIICTFILGQFLWMTKQQNTVAILLYFCTHQFGNIAQLSQKYASNKNLP